jgi:ribosome recycling factor
VADRRFADARPTLTIILVLILVLVLVLVLEKLDNTPYTNRLRGRGRRATKVERPPFEALAWDFEQPRSLGSPEFSIDPARIYGYNDGIMTLDEILLEAEEKMIKTEQKVINDFAGVRTGRASAGLVENIIVEVYGSQMRIRELANINTPEPRMLVVQPWDAATLQPIEKAIQKANIGLSPAVQGKLIRLSFPELSTERRQEFVKLIKKMAEDGRVSVRHIRRDAMELLKKHGHDSGITEDNVKQAEKDLQKLTDDYTAKVDVQVTGKEKEIMTV